MCHNFGMARFGGLDPRLDPYGSETNRARAVSLSDEFEGNVRSHSSPGLSVVVLNRDSPELLESVLTGFKSARAQFVAAGVGCELIIGDTGSSDQAAVHLLEVAESDGASVTRGLKYQFSANNNVLSELAKYPTTLFMNNDVLLSRNPSCLWMAYEVHRRTTDIVSLVLDLEDGRVQHRGVDFLRDNHFYGLSFHPGAGVASRHTLGEEISWPAVTGAFLMIDTMLFARLGGFDESYAAECQDIDLCLKANRLGVGCRVVDAGPTVHLENATRPKGEENWHDRQRFVRRWSSYVETL